MEFPELSKILCSIRKRSRRSYDTVPCLPHSYGTAVFVVLANLWAMQMNCQLESAQCAPLLVPIADTFLQVIKIKYIGDCSFSFEMNCGPASVGD